MILHADELRPAAKLRCMERLRELNNSLTKNGELLLDCYPRTVPRGWAQTTKRSGSGMCGGSARCSTRATSMTYWSPGIGQRASEAR